MVEECSVTEKKHPDEERYQKRVECLVMSRVVGFITPQKFWNVGKKREWVDRLPYKVPEKLE